MVVLFHPWSDRSADAWGRRRVWRQSCSSRHHHRNNPVQETNNGHVPVRTPPAGFTKTINVSHVHKIHPGTGLRVEWTDILMLVVEWQFLSPAWSILHQSENHNFHIFGSTRVNDGLPRDTNHARPLEAVKRFRAKAPLSRFAN